MALAALAWRSLKPEGPLDPKSKEGWLASAALFVAPALLVTLPPLAAATLMVRAAWARRTEPGSGSLIEIFPWATLMNSQSYS